MLQILSDDCSRNYCTMSGDAVTWSVLHVEVSFDRISVGLC